MDWIRVIIACLLLVAAPLRVYAASDCCPPQAMTGGHDHAAHATHAHGDPAPQGVDGEDGCAKPGCVQHCATPAAAMPAVATAPAPLRPALSLDSGSSPPPSAPDGAPERPPRTLA